ncbi:hypothetical protein BT96DRAFT_594405 [Gymnopus androsaceus JB14]|uniref:Uncharacterized protein n=1 Tax=Gymnopus androsaceus JB14 TaxID=1447944 RepID=A0A6A4HUD0_9AGAR|nr:hypothetical protein BT96DRAFT_594405 [Gymnopus androsaceus JB14]
MCLKHMEQQLRFNICHLESSYIANEDVTNPEMKERIQKYISEELRYSCESWVYHACAMAESSQCWTDIASFMGSTNIVYWMECLSCLNETSQIKTSMDYLANITKILEIGIGSKDISKFISACFLPISQQHSSFICKCIGHAPRENMAGRLYWQKLKGYSESKTRSVESILEGRNKSNQCRGMCILCGILPRWEADYFGVNRQKSENLECRDRSSHWGAIERTCRFSSVSGIFPRWKRIVSGSVDKSVRIWSAETGLRIGEPLRGHTDSVSSVAYSPDGKQIVSGSTEKTVKNLECRDRSSHWGATERTYSSVLSVACSPNRKQISFRIS